LKHVIQTEYRALFNRHVPDGRTGGSWEKFYDRWQHHTSVQTFIDMFGKAQAQSLYREHLDECQRVQRQKLIDERLIPIIELLLNDSRSKISRNWDFVRYEMQKNPRYSSTVISTNLWSDFERNNSNSLAIPEDLLQTNEARLRFENYVNQRQAEQTRRFHSRAFFELLSRFADAGLVHYGDSFDKDSVYFLGRESFESLSNVDRLKIFALHQSFLYRLLCLQFVELLLESMEIFLQTFEKMNLATKFADETTIQRRKTLTIDEIFQKEILEEIQHDPRYRALNKRETDRHRLIMFHCHFLYDSIYYPTRWIRRHHRSWKRRKSSSISSNSNLDEHFCPYTRKDRDKSSKSNLDIACPMENDCADSRIYHELFIKFQLKPMKKNILIFGNRKEISEIYEIYSNDVYLNNDFPINPIAFDQFENESIDGCLLICEKAQEMFDSFVTNRSNLLVPFAHLTDVDSDEHSSENIPPTERLRCALENLFSSIETFRSTNIPIDLKLLLVFMCGGEKNHVETFLTHLSQRFSLIGNGQSSFIINIPIGRTQRKVEFVCVSFHSIFAWKLDEFDGFCLFYDRDRKAAVKTMTYLQKFISNVFVKDRRRRPIFLFSTTREMSFSSLRTLIDVQQQLDDPVQNLHGSIKTFVEAHLIRCLNQCWINKTDEQIDRDFCRSEEILAGVQSYFHRVNQSLPINVMTHSLDRTFVSSRSNDHSPKHRHSSLLPSTHEQINSYRSYPHLSQTTCAADSTIVPTTPVDPSLTNLSLISSTTSTSDSSQQYFQKSTSMRFAKLIEHPTNGIRSSTIPEETKFQIYKDRPSSQVKVPLATPEIVEFNEFLTATTITNPISSSNESSSDERISTGLQRKVSDRKLKRIRPKQNDVTESASSNEILQKRRPSSKRRKKFFTDQTQTDSGIDSRMDSKDSNKIQLTSSSNFIVSNEEDSSVGDGPKDSKNTSIEELEERPAGNWIRRQLQYFAQARRDKSESKSRSSAIVTVSSPPFLSSKTTTTSSNLSAQSNPNVSPLTSMENSSHHVPQRFILSRCPLDETEGVPIFILKCIRFIEENGLTIEGLYRISGYKNQVELVIHKLNSDPNCDLNLLQIPASAVATALKDMMRKLDEPILSLEQFNECQTFTIEQLREQEFRVLQKALRRTTDLKYRTSNVIFKHLHFVAQHAASTHMDSSNLAVLWWPNLFQPQFHDLRTAEQICQKAKPLIQTIIDHYPLIFSIEQLKMF